MTETELDYMTYQIQNHQKDRNSSELMVQEYQSEDFKQWDQNSPFAHNFVITGPKARKLSKYSGSCSQIVSHPLPSSGLHEVYFHFGYGDSILGITVGLFTKQRKDQQWSRGGSHSNTLSYTTKAKGNQEETGWIYMSGQIVAGGSDYFVPETSLLYMRVDISNHMVTFINMSTEKSKIVYLPNCFKDEQLYVFSTMGNERDSVAMI